MPLLSRIKSYGRVHWRNRDSDFVKRGVKRLSGLKLPGYFRVNYLSNHYVARRACVFKPP